MTAFLIIGLVVAFLMGGLLSLLRIRMKPPSPEVRERVRQRERDIEAAEKAEGDRDDRKP
jgi:hypothetical protein